MTRKDRNKLEKIVATIWSGVSPPHVRSIHHEEIDVHETYILQNVRDYDKDGRPILRGQARLRMLTGAGVLKLQPPAENIRLIDGRARGLDWWAGCNPLPESAPYQFPALIWLAYAGQAGALLTPKRIPAIVTRLEAMAAEEKPYEGYPFDPSGAAAWREKWDKASKAAGESLAALIHKGRNYGRGLDPDKTDTPQTDLEETAPATTPAEASKTSTQPQAGETLKFDWPPIKALGIAATANHETSISEWKRNKRHKQRDKNPILAGDLKKTTVKVFFGGKQADGQTLSSYEEPNSVEDLRKFLQVAFGGPAYAALLGLTWIGKKTGKDTFNLKFTELSRRIYGDRPSKMQSQKLWQTIQALDRATIVMETHNKGGGVSEYRIFPLTIFGVDWKTDDKQRPPKTLRVRVFDMGADNGRNAGFIAIPDSVFSLNESQFALASYVLLEKQHSRAGYPVKVDIDRAMQAAGLVRTWKNDPRGAKKRMREKLAALHQVGLVGPFEKFEGSYIILAANKALGEAKQAGQDTDPSGA